VATMYCGMFIGGRQFINHSDHCWCFFLRAFM